ETRGERGLHGAPGERLAAQVQQELVAAEARRGARGQDHAGDGAAGLSRHASPPCRSRGSRIRSKERLTYTRPPEASNFVGGSVHGTGTLRRPRSLSSIVQPSRSEREGANGDRSCVLAWSRLPPTARRSIPEQTQDAGPPI